MKEKEKIISYTVRVTKTDGGNVILMFNAKHKNDMMQQLNDLIPEMRGFKVLEEKVLED